MDCDKPYQGYCTRASLDVGDGDDRLYAGSGNDTLEGGNGDDTAFLSGIYALQRSDDDYAYYSDGTYTVKIDHDIEEVQFIDE